VARADGLQLPAHRRVRQLRLVAITAQVAEVKMLKVRRHDFRRQIRRCVVGKMPVPTHDALLHAPWPAHVVLEHLQIVIGFQHQHVCLPHPFHDELRGVTKVG